MYRAFVMLAALTVVPGALADGVTLHFTLLTWDDSQAGPELPSAVGWKPAQSSKPCDWLLFTEDDYEYASGWNPLGAISHNIADPAGAGGSGFVMAPSLTGEAALTMEFSYAGSDSWDVHIIHQEYIGQATTVAQMNQTLVSEGDPATLDPVYNVDGLPNAGAWERGPANNWSISYVLDFYLASNTDGDPDPLDIDATFDDQPQTGYLIPVAELTEAGMAAVELDDPAGFFDGDFEQYLLDEIAPRLPAEATCLLVTQMEKCHPVYHDDDVSITLGSLVGNTTIAYATQPLPILGDLDGDGDVDLDDFNSLAGCLDGPQFSLQPGCEPADFDGDDDMDLADFGVFQAAFTGELIKLVAQASCLR
ncbi:MAG: hypothetical protein KAV82_03880 [Phycisphaerae bacterium]|nr:hypothetical protein [Phycisphaerae bacterium]